VLSSIVVNSQTTTAAFRKVVQQQYQDEVGKTQIVYVVSSRRCVQKITKIGQYFTELFEK